MHFLLHIFWSLGSRHLILAAYCLRKSHLIFAKLTPTLSCLSWSRIDYNVLERSTCRLHLSLLESIHLAILIKIDYGGIIVMHCHWRTLLTCFPMRIILQRVLVKLLKLWSILMMLGLGSCQSSINGATFLRGLEIVKRLSYRIQHKLVGLVLLLLHLLLLCAGRLLTCLDRVSFAFIWTLWLRGGKVIRLFIALILFVFGCFRPISRIRLHIQFSGSFQNLFVLLVLSRIRSSTRVKLLKLAQILRFKLVSQLFKLLLILLFQIWGQA